LLVDLLAACAAGELDRSAKRQVFDLVGEARGVLERCTMSEHAQVIVFALGAVWAAFGTATTVYYRLNEIRDRVLDWSESGTRLNPDQKAFLLWWDYRPIWFSVLAFIVIITTGITLLAWHAFSNGWIGAGSVCSIVVLFGLLGIVITVSTGRKSIKMMSDHISSLRKGAS
jgi:hypothetical protein